MQGGVPVLTVSQYLAALNEVLAEQRAVIEGEVAEFRIWKEQWVFFKLKDEVEAAVLDCFLSIHQLPFPIQDGDKLTVAGYPRVRPQSGKFSFVVQSLTVSGEGRLRKAFQELQKKLEREGLFDPKYKQPIPRFPEAIGLITSKEGAVLHDILRTINDRWGGLKIILHPVAVQGQTAIPEIVSALEHFNRSEPVDTLILARGGGSLEDLQAFNSEPVTRAIFSSRIPVVTGVGHEPDLTLADLVADVRAPTPTAAAKLVVSDRTEVQAALAGFGQRLVFSQRTELAALKSDLDHCAMTLSRLAQAVIHRVTDLFARFRAATVRTGAGLVHQEELLRQFRRRMAMAFAGGLREFQGRLLTLERTLRSLSPLQVLERGYSLTMREAGGIITDPKSVSLGSKIRSRVAKGTIFSRVEADG